MLKYAKKESDCYQLACRLAKEAYAYFEENFPLESMHETACFVELYEDMKDCDCHTLFSLERFEDLLQQQIKQLITYDTKIWNIDYVCKPSLFIANKLSDFYLDNKNICHFECEFIRNHQNKDGTWSVTWDWQDYPEQWAISKNWWKSDIIIKNIKSLRTFDC